jgi:hypothetical protein
MIAYLFEQIMNPNINTNNNYSHIKGNWIETSKNIKLQSNILCVEFRTDKLSEYIVKNNYFNNNNNFYRHIIYKKSCIEINSKNTSYTNINATFAIDNKQTNKNNQTYINNSDNPKGSWHKTARRISYFQNNICAFLQVNCKNYNSVKNCFYDEQCIYYNKNDYLVNDNGKLKKMNYEQYVMFEYLTN